MGKQMRISPRQSRTGRSRKLESVYYNDDQQKNTLSIIGRVLNVLEKRIMSEKKLPTDFAPAERDSQERVQKQSRSLLAVSMLRQLLDAVPEILLILNDKRQIVFANQRLLDVLGCQDAKTLIGARFGETLECRHSSETAGGCGTTEACKHCGAALAILSSQKGKADVRECRISQGQGGEALNLKVNTTPFTLEGKQYIIFCATDVSGENRREVLERVLFEGILNGAKEVKEKADELQGANATALHLFREDTSRFSNTLVEEINEHRILTAAERDDLYIHPRGIDTLDMLKTVIRFFENREEAEGRILQIHRQASDATLITDPTVLKQVLGYMVKNALEASERSETITLNVDAQAKEVEFFVHNSNFIPKAVQLQIFQRGFSTKGEGRGLGTYAMRLLSEKCLKGKVSFVSTPNIGTTFKACYPSII